MYHRHPGDSAWWWAWQSEVSLKRPKNGATFRFIWKDLVSGLSRSVCLVISPFITIQGNAEMAKVLIQCDTSQVMIDQWTHKQWSRQAKPPSRVWTRCSFRLRSHVVAGFLCDFLGSPNGWSAVQQLRDLSSLFLVLLWMACRCTDETVL